MNAQLDWAQKTRKPDLRALSRQVVVVLLAMLAVIGGMALVRRPAMVDHVTITNRTSFDLDVDLVDEDRVSVIPLSIVVRHDTDTIGDVLDVGRRWVFVVTRQGEEVGRVTRSRAQLVADGWHVDLPGSLEARLTELGQEPCTRC